KEGLTISASDGTMCETFLQGKVTMFDVAGAGMRQAYEPPAHAKAIPTGHDIYAINKMLQKDHSRELLFEPVLFKIGCDPDTCQGLIEESFVGLERSSGAEGAGPGSSARLPAWAAKQFEQTARERKENAFAHFHRAPLPGNRYYQIAVARDLDEPFYAKFFRDNLIANVPYSGVYLDYDNWGGWEVTFTVWPARLDMQGTMAGTIFGYYTEETVKTVDPYSLEGRTDQDSRWYDLFSVNGTVDVAVEDPEL